MSKPGTRPGPEPSELRGPQLLGLRFSWDSFAQMHDRRQETRVPLEPSNFIRGRSVWTMGVTVDGARKRRGTKAAAKSTATKAVEEATPVFENPLVPNAVLQEMYQKMVELRQLSQHARKAGRKGKTGLRLASMIGPEG